MRGARKERRGEGRGVRLARLTRAGAVEGGADLSDDGEEADPGAGTLLEGVGDREVREMRLPGRGRRRRRRGHARPLGLPR